MAAPSKQYNAQTVRKELNDLLPKMMKLGGKLVIEFERDFTTDKQCIKISCRHAETRQKYGLIVNPEKDGSFVDWFIAGVTATLRTVLLVKTP